MLKGEPDLPFEHALRCNWEINELQEFLTTLSNGKPSILSVENIGVSWKKEQNSGGFDLLSYRITSQKKPGNVKPKILIISGLHANELAPVNLTYHWIQQIVYMYGYDEEITWLVDEHDIRVIPIANPDGYEFVHNQKRKKRGNLNNQCKIDGLSDDAGVDLNRNFSFNWGEIPGGSSGDACDLTYRGLSPASEPEVKALEAYISQLFNEQTDTADASLEQEINGLILDLHSNAGVVLYNDQLNKSEIFTDYLHRLASKIGSKLETPAISVTDLYPADGTSDGPGLGGLNIPSLTIELDIDLTAPTDNCKGFIEYQQPKYSALLSSVVSLSGKPYLYSGFPTINKIAINESDKEDIWEVNAYLSQNTGLEILKVEDKVLTSAIISKSYPPSKPSEVLNKISIDNLSDEGGELSFTFSISEADLQLGENRLFVYTESDDNLLSRPKVVNLVHNGESIKVEPNFTILSNCESTLCNFSVSTKENDNTDYSFKWETENQIIGTGSEASWTFSDEGVYSVFLEIEESIGVNYKRHLLASAITQQPFPSFTSVIECLELKCKFEVQPTFDLDVQEYSNHKWIIIEEGSGKEIFSTNAASFEFEFETPGEYIADTSLMNNYGLSNRTSHHFTVDRSEPEEQNLESERDGGGSLTLTYIVFLISLSGLFGVTRIR